MASNDVAASTATASGDRVHTPVTAATVTSTTEPSPSWCQRRKLLTSYARRIETSTISHQPVPWGPRAYRAKLRGAGPVVALIPAGVLGVVSLLLLHGHSSLLRGVAGFLAAVFAAPGLLVAGVPLRSGGNVYVAAIGGSAVMWMLLGAVAARRATRSPAATWRDYWREYLWLALGVWLGVVVALVVVNVVLGRALF